MLDLLLFAGAWLPIPLVRKICFLIGALRFAHESLNSLSSYRQNTFEHPAVLVLESPDVCLPKTQLFLGSGGPSPAFFRQQQCDEESEFRIQSLYGDVDNLSLLTDKLTKIIKENPELESELLPFLKGNRVIDESGATLDREERPFILKAHVVTKFDKSLKRRTIIENESMLVFNKNEVIFIRSPQTNSKKAMDEYNKWKKIYRLPTTIRNLVLKNKKLLGSLQEGQFSFIGQIDRDNFQIKLKQEAQPELIHTFQKSYLGYWRYVGVAEENSFREIFHRNFGRSPV